jgi:hypothetical protein
MNRTSAALLCVLGTLMASTPAPGQEPRPVPAGSCSTCTEGPASGLHGGGGGCCHWTAGCFPRCDCPDDYCPNPYPRQCWPPYPPFYRCVPAGDCAHPPCVGVGNEKLTWWWIPTPRALREALWCRP